MGGSAARGSVVCTKCHKGVSKDSRHDRRNQAFSLPARSLASRNREPFLCLRHRPLYLQEDDRPFLQGHLRLPLNERQIRNNAPICVVDVVVVVGVAIVVDVARVVLVIVVGRAQPPPAAIAFCNGSLTCLGSAQVSYLSASLGHVTRRHLLPFLVAGNPLAQEHEALRLEL